MNRGVFDILLINMEVIVFKYYVFSSIYIMKKKRKCVGKIQFLFIYAI